MARMGERRDTGIRNDGIWDGGEMAGVEEPMTDEAESKGLEADSEAGPVSQDASDSFRTGGVDAGTGAGAGAGAGVDAVDKTSLLSGSGHALTIPRCVVSSGRTDIVVAGGVFWGAAGTTLGADASVGRGLVTSE